MRRQPEVVVDVFFDAREDSFGSHEAKLPLLPCGSQSAKENAAPYSLSSGSFSIFTAQALIGVLFHGQFCQEITNHSVKVFA